jgi:hypothetical protein
MIELLFILIYLVSLMIHIVICYKENKRHISHVGDLIDKIDFYMWVPVLNTLMLLWLLLFTIGITITKLDILWKKFRNIKLR